MKPQPFCCDITSGTTEERKEFKKLFEKASKDEWTFASQYYGFSKLYGWDGLTNSNDLAAIEFFTNILPLSEGIAILKQMVGEEEKPTYTEQEIDFAYLAGVFNASGIDGLYNEIQRLKSLGKNPHDIIIEGRNQPRP